MTHSASSVLQIRPVSFKHHLRQLTAAAWLVGVAGLTTAGLVATSNAFADPSEMHYGHHAMDHAKMDKMLERHVERMAKGVNATTDQTARLIVIAKNAENDIKPLREQIKHRMDQAQQEFKAVLTPEQQTKWDAQVKMHHKRMEKEFKD